MAYQVLARKWRPQDFASLVGQQAVVTALSNALRDGRIAQAYLFSGIRGVGKTTAARVFAKALNCERGTENGPCNVCPTCIQITAGSDMDVLEIDAATYSKVEQVRELAESLKYGPARDRYKVVVLDEVHRLSRQAFDALLKIVEEPPPRLVFIFATTEIDAVPATILSRCQEFHFRRVSNVEAVAHLRHICDAEKITASDAALAVIARAGEGSMRDAVALLDQLATFGNGTIDEQEAIRVLGGIDLALFLALLSAILEGDQLAVSRLARSVEDNGSDPRTVHAHFLAYCRDALHLALGESGDALALPAEERRALTVIAKGAGYENLLRLLHHLLGSESAIRRSEAGALALEIAWLRATELPRLVAIERLLSGGTLAGSPAPSGGLPSSSGRPAAGPQASAARGPSAAAVPSTAAATLTEPRASAPPAPASAPAARPSAGADSGMAATPAGVAGLAGVPAIPAIPAIAAIPAVAAIADSSTLAPASVPAGAHFETEAAVRAFLEQLVLRRPTLAALFEEPDSLSWDDGARLLTVQPASDFAASSLHRNRELISTAALAAFGAGVNVRFAKPEPRGATSGGSGAAGDRVSDRAAGRSSGASGGSGGNRRDPAGQAAASAEERKSQVSDHPRVQAVLEIFGGAVATVSAPPPVMPVAPAVSAAMTTVVAPPPPGTRAADPMDDDAFYPEEDS